MSPHLQPPFRPTPPP
ncbi:hypothetical protein LINGRAHAP2_LOCUS21610 [Linum grandiflorum]